MKKLFAILILPLALSACAGSQLGEVDSLSKAGGTYVGIKPLEFKADSKVHRQIDMAFAKDCQNCVYEFEMGPNGLPSKVKITLGTSLASTVVTAASDSIEAFMKAHQAEIEALSPAAQSGIEGILSLLRTAL